jgi:hypothetical protein
MYGGRVKREKFLSDLKINTLKLRPSPKVTFYFGSRDPVSSVSDLPLAFEKDRSVIVYDSDHTFIAAREKSFIDIMRKIDGSN